MTIAIGLKSITQIRLTKTVLIFLITILLYSKVIDARNDKEIVMKNLPKVEDLDGYLTALEAIVDFVVKHKVYVDLNFNFGLFLINANLKNLLSSKSGELPEKVRTRLENLMIKNDIVQDYFRSMVSKIHGENDSVSVKIHKLFFNESTWPKYLPNFMENPVPKTKLYTVKQLNAIYGKWEVYVYNVFNFKRYIPSPKKSDYCMSELAMNKLPLNHFHQLKFSVPKCDVPNECRITKGSEFGYAFVHRILFLIFAHITRNCVVFDRKIDRAMLNQHCLRTFIEAQYIVANDYQMIDLLLEQITLCGLSGYVQFLQRSWISKVQEFQTSQGCFSIDRTIAKANVYMEEGKNEHWEVEHKDHTIMGGGCDAHLTAVAAGTFSLAIRYIIEKFY